MQWAVFTNIFDQENISTILTATIYLHDHLTYTLLTLSPLPNQYSLAHNIIQDCLFTLIKLAITAILSSHVKSI